MSGSGRTFGPRFPDGSGFTSLLLSQWLWATSRCISYHFPFQPLNANGPVEIKLPVPFQSSTRVHDKCVPLYRLSENQAALLSFVFQLPEPPATNKTQAHALMKKKVEGFIAVKN